MFFYNVGIGLYGLALRIASVFHEKASKWLKGRSGSYWSDLREAIKKHPKPVWFHCASLGEFEQARPIIEEHKKRFPTTPVLLTFFSPSGYEVRKKYSGADIVVYMPLDTPSKARKFLEITNPKAVIFVKYEFWLNHLNEAIKRSIPIFLISGIFREKQVFFSSFGAPYRKTLRRFARVFVQDEKSASLLDKIGISDVEVAGDTRFDRVQEIRNSNYSNPTLEHFKNHNTLIAGSTWPIDEEFIANWVNQSDDRFAIIAPHEIGDKHIAGITEQFEGAVRLSDNFPNAKVLVVDSIGNLSKIYRYGSFAYIGGGFGAGLHNTLEAAVYGLPVIFGPNHKKFNEAVELGQCGGGFPISETDQFARVAERLSDPEFRKSAGLKAADYVEQKTGATHKFFASYRHFK
jgi:3-deoxy-D-manno-octulosonic-acid transferase